MQAANKAFQRDAIAVSHLLQRAQKLRHGNCAPEQRRYACSFFHQPLTTLEKSC